MMNAPSLIDLLILSKDWDAVRSRDQSTLRSEGNPRHYFKVCYHLFFLFFWLAPSALFMPSPLLLIAMLMHDIKVKVDTGLFSTRSLLPTTFFFLKKMGSSSFFPFTSLFVYVTFISLLLLLSSSSAQLSTNFYSKTCPRLLSTVKSVVESAVSKEKRMGASLLRLHFHDCFVNGCDGSILLKDTSSFMGEQTARPNKGSIRGYNVIDNIKSKVESVCPGVVSCADIVAIAARDSTVYLGGPTWDVKLGRRDSRTASFSKADGGALPGPNSNLTNLINRFQAVGLSAKDMVALSGSHTIGVARCISFRNHIYNDTNIDSSFAKTRKKFCPKNPPSGDTNPAPLDLQTPTFFDNNYFKNIINHKGLLHSDQVLHSGGTTDSLVEKYSQDHKTFNSDFATAMIKMGDITPLTGSRGEIRKICSKVN